MVILNSEFSFSWPKLLKQNNVKASSTRDTWGYGYWFPVMAHVEVGEYGSYEIQPFETTFDYFEGGEKMFRAEKLFPCDEDPVKEILISVVEIESGEVVASTSLEVKCQRSVIQQECDATVNVPEKAKFNEPFNVDFTFGVELNKFNSWEIELPSSKWGDTTAATIVLQCTPEGTKKVRILAYQHHHQWGDKKCLDETRKVCCYKDADTKCDPHFTTFSGDKYDYHGECDLVVLHNPKYKNGLGMYVHVRTKIETFYSYIHTAVLQIGEETFEVTGAPYNQVWLNGIPSVVFPARISGHAIGHRQFGEHQHRYNIILGQGDGEHIEISTYKHFVGVSVKQGTAETFEGSLGLLGSFETGKKVARDGSTIIDKPNDFGQEWQVLPSDPRLFRNMEGPQYPEKCLLPTISSRESRNLRVGSITPEQAHAACASVSSDEYDNCVFDVMATDDIGIAGAY